MLSKSRNNDQTNHLHLLWSCHKLYIDNSFRKEINYEMRKVRIEGQGGSKVEIAKEMDYITGPAFGRKKWTHFVNCLLDWTNLYSEFLKAYALTVIILSKVLAFEKVPMQSFEHELHEVFDLIRSNLKS